MDTVVTDTQLLTPKELSQFVSQPISDLALKTSRYKKHTDFIHYYFDEVALTGRQAVCVHGLLLAVHAMFIERYPELQTLDDIMLKDVEKKNRVFYIHKSYFLSLLGYKEIKSIEMLVRKIFEPLKEKSFMFNVLSDNSTEKVIGEGRALVPQQPANKDVGFSHLIGAVYPAEDDRNYLVFEVPSPMMRQLVAPGPSIITSLLYSLRVPGSISIIESMHLAMAKGKDVIGPYPVSEFKKMFGANADYRYNTFKERKVQPLIEVFDTSEDVPFKITEYIEEYDATVTRGRRPVSRVGFRFVKKQCYEETKARLESHSKKKTVWMLLQRYGFAQNQQQALFDEMRFTVGEESQIGLIDFEFAEFVANATRNLSLFQEFLRQVTFQVGGGEFHTPKIDNLPAYVRKHIIWNRKLEYCAIRELISNVLISKGTSRDDPEWRSWYSELKDLMQTRIIARRVLHASDIKNDRLISQWWDRFLQYFDVVEADESEKRHDDLRLYSFLNVPDYAKHHLFAFLSNAYNVGVYMDYYEILDDDHAALKYHEANMPIGTLFLESSEHHHM